MAEKKEKQYVRDNAYFMRAWGWGNNVQEFVWTEITFGSNKKIWWFREKGYEWQATSNNRSCGQSYPVCTG